MKTIRTCAGLIILCWLLLPGFGADAPPWLNEAAKIPVPASAAGAPAVVLLNDTRLELDDRGRLTETNRVAIRILNNTGKKYATGLLHYNGASAEVQAINAWVIREGRTVDRKGKAEWLDIANNSPGAVIDEKRTSMIDLSDRTVAGDVMGYETRVRTPLVVAQLYWLFGHRLPQVRESVQLVVPAGFTVSHESHGERQPEATQSGNAWTWSLAGQPYLPEETLAPDSAWYPSEVLIRVQAPSTGPLRSYALHDFANWSEVTALYEKLNAGQCDSSPALVAKARELVDGESDGLARIKRLAQYVQSLRYVGIYRGLRYGYGWKARKASEVFATGFGDCKDKSNLLMAMLREVGIKSHRVIARLDAERLVRHDFASPIQFDHAIIAIEVPETVSLPAVVPVAGVGRLLFFDPTNPHTLVGDLSIDLQGGYVHLVAAEISELIRLPEFQTESGFCLERRMEISLSADGSLSLKGNIAGVGQAGAKLRSLIQEAGTSLELAKLATRQLAVGFKSAALTEATGSDDPVSGRAGLSFICQKKGYLQFNPDGTAVLKLDVLGRQHLPNLSSQNRQLPVAISPLAMNDTLAFQLPRDFVVEELPRGTEVKTDFGTFTIRYEREGDRLVLSRQLVLIKKTVSASEYARLRQFFSDVSRADRTSVLIRKKS